MTKSKTAPVRMRNFLILTLVGTLISFGITFFVYKVSRDAAQGIGRDTVPSIVAAQNIKATLAGAHSNAMNAMVTGEKLDGKFWGLYRRDMDSLHSQLVEASRNITFGDAERIPLTKISSNISSYEYTVGGAVANGAQISVDQFMEANRLMQQRILPASTALNRVNLLQLESIYENYNENIDLIIAVMIIVGLCFLTLLIFIQSYLFRRTHRVFNTGLLFASLLLSASLIYSAAEMNSVKKDLYEAKTKAFTSVNALWNARAAAYNAKSIESLYLLHEGTGIVQTADTINFNLTAASICSDPKDALNGGKYEGYLYDIGSIASSGDKELLINILQQWEKYVNLDKEVHNLEYDSRHSEAVALSVGDEPDKGFYEFSKFDKAIGNMIEANSEEFESCIDSALNTLSIFPFVLLALMFSIAASCILGMKPRLDEYRV